MCRRDEASEPADFASFFWPDSPVITSLLSNILGQLFSPISFWPQTRPDLLAFPPVLQAPPSTSPPAQLKAAPSERPTEQLSVHRSFYRSPSFATSLLLLTLPSVLLSRVDLTVGLRPAHFLSLLDAAHLLRRLRRSSSLLGDAAWLGERLPRDEARRGTGPGEDRRVRRGAAGVGEDGGGGGKMV